MGKLWIPRSWYRLDTQKYADRGDLALDKFSDWPCTTV